MADGRATVSIAMIATCEIGLLNNYGLIIGTSFHLHLLLSYIFLEGYQDGVGEGRLLVGVCGFGFSLV